MPSLEVNGERSETNRSIATLPPELEKQIEELEQQFWVSKEKLRKIVDRFQEELTEGLEKGGQNIPMNITWVWGFPTGEEKGQFLTFDLGGTNLRICWVTLNGKDEEIGMDQEEFEVPDDLKTSTADKLWEFSAGSLGQFIKDKDLKGTVEDPIRLGFTFSYPADQHKVDHGILQTWTKGFDIDGVEGNDVVAQFREAIKKHELPIELVALVNDTTGAMIASAYKDPETIIGAIFGTGCNAAYMEDCGSISKMNQEHCDPKTQIAINCEYGAFDNARRVLPLTKYDKTIDAESPRPGEQAFEKTSAGLYLGEIYRLVMLDMYEQGLVWKGQDISSLQEAYAVDSAFLSTIEDDESSGMSDTQSAFRDRYGVSMSETELEFSRQLAGMIAMRAARLCTCGVAAICSKKGIKKGRVAADGSVANKNPVFRQRWGAALAEVLDWPKDRDEDPIVLGTALDGSGIGAAVISAMTVERSRKGQRQAS